MKKGLNYLVDNLFSSRNFKDLVTLPSASVHSPQSCFGARCKNQDFEADWGGGGGDWYGGHKGWLAISKLKPLSLFISPF